MNKTIITGRLTAVPVYRTTQSGITVATFTVAVTRRFKRDGDKDADFFRCTAFGKIAETLDRCNVTTGTKLLCEGEMRNNDYEKDGIKHYGMQMLVSVFEFCESKSATESRQDAPQQAQGVTPQTYQATVQTAHRGAQNQNTAQKTNNYTPLDDLSDFEEILSDGETPF